jgi:hypothetical protein
LLGKTYVVFALRHPAHFKLMFRSEWVKAEKHEEAKACADGAFDVLAGAIADVARAEGGEADQIALLMAWSMAHGLATLMLEGKFEKVCGDDHEAQMAAASAVFERFEAMQRAAYAGRASSS